MWLYSCCSISPSLFHSFSYCLCTPFPFFYFLLYSSSLPPSLPCTSLCTPFLTILSPSPTHSFCVPFLYPSFPLFLPPFILPSLSLLPSLPLTLTFPPSFPPSHSPFPSLLPSSLPPFPSLSSSSCSV